MANFTAADVKKLREQTGAGMMDCKKALDEAEGNFTKAAEIVKQKGLAKAEKKADRETKEGYIASYVHTNHKIASMLEILCETDFVARNEEFRQMANDVALHLVSMRPENVVELLSQEFVKDPSVTIEEMVKGVSGKVGEKLVINRFMVYAVGE